MTRLMTRLDNIWTIWSEGRISEFCNWRVSKCSPTSNRKRLCTEKCGKERSKFSERKISLVKKKRFRGITSSVSKPFIWWRGPSRFEKSEFKGLETTKIPGNNLAESRPTPSLDKIFQFPYSVVIKDCMKAGKPLAGHVWTTRAPQPSTNYFSYVSTYPAKH